MKYILEYDEYHDLLKEIKDAENANKKVIQQLCTQVAENMPVLYWNNKEASIWGCILTETEDGYRGGMEYCDECPVQDVCPCTRKRWSK